MDFEIYKNKAPYPDHPVKAKHPDYKNATPDELRRYADAVEVYDKEMAAWKVKRNEWNQVQSALNEKFKEHAIREAGLTGHAKADKCWDKAWDEGHSAGNSEVLYWLKEFAEIVLP